ncbi:tRNA lysidine(34) synthetase TilS [bacterium]|nr:MAG: tRNA lysidine(34) synthetase TilS [bacterium]
MRQTTKSFQKQFLEHCRKKNFFSSNDRVLLAVSGGMDSMALSHLIGILQLESKITIGIAHLNHRLRGAASDRDEAFVKTFALSHEYPFHCKRLDVRKQAKLSKKSIEEEAHNLRYTFFEKTAKQFGYNKICTAHHRSDQAETILMRIIKGSGMSGLSGIREKRGLFVRPLLVFSKEDIKKYVQAEKIKYVNDASNRDTAILRNRIRHDLIPLLRKKFDLQIEKHLIQLGLIAEETKSHFNRNAKKQYLQVCKASDGKIVLEIKAFNRYLRAQRHALIEFLFWNEFDQKLQFSDYERLSDLIEKKQSGKKVIFGNVICLKTADQIIFLTKNRLASPDFCFRIETGRNYSWKDPGFSFRSSFLPYSSELKSSFGRILNVEYIDKEKITGHLRLRNWKIGDKFKPIGMNGFKKLSDFFVDNKIPVLKKKKIPLLCEKIGTKENIIWVCGLRLDDRYKVDNRTRHLLKLEYNLNE